MRITLYVIHSLAFFAQIVGGYLVVRETVTTLRNVGALRDSLKAAEAAKQEHRESLRKTPTSVPGERLCLRSPHITKIRGMAGASAYVSSELHVSRVSSASPSGMVAPVRPRS